MNIKVPIPNSKVDERDTMFARMARRKNTDAYIDYYNNNPNLKKKDDHIRSMPPLLHKDGKYFDKALFSQADNYFETIDDIHIDEKLVEKYLQIILDHSSINKALKQIILDLGAVAVGFTDLEQQFVYSHKGRFDYNYGKKIDNSHHSVIVFLVEMNYKRMQSAPKADTILESANQYYNAAYISKVIEVLIDKFGYDAKAHFDANYDAILPPLAIKAGLGELGRNNILIANNFGSRVRIGAISTNLEMRYDSPISIGAENFCKVCKKCADNCPSKALSLNGKSKIRGIDKWTTDVEKCYTIWRRFGTDCGICMAVCPYSHKNNLMHNGIRKIVKYVPILNKVMVMLDDIIYGKKWKIKD